MNWRLPVDNARGEFTVPEGMMRVDNEDGSREWTIEVDCGSHTHLQGGILPTRSDVLAVPGVEVGSTNRF